MRDICFLKFVNTLVMHYVSIDDFCKVKTVYSISIHSLKFGFRFILITLYNPSIQNTLISRVSVTNPIAHFHFVFLCCEFIF
jgi:hypothetical protein